jgi:outer membrane protein OmpA-like peptidoglycan-associated protein
MIIFILVVLTLRGLVMLKKLCVASLLFVCCTVVVSAQEDRWYDSFFVEAAGQYYFTPGFFSGLVEPDIGFRGALGYEYRRFRFALESGYTHITGTNPLALDFRFVPLSFKTGYALPLGKGWGLQADLDLGFIFSDTIHYETAIDMLMDKKKESSTRSFAAGMRLYGTYSFLRRSENTYALKAYAGGGIDVIFETDGPIPLPLFELGISFKPLSLIKPTASREQKTTLAEMPPIEPEKLVFAPTPENIVIEENKSGKTVRLLNAVYFEANSVKMIEQYRPILNEAGERLKANPALRMTLRAYAAPFGTEDGQVAVSAARAWFCVEHYMKNYGIAEARMKIEYYGAERSPEFKDASWESYRCVELIIE